MSKKILILDDDNDILDMLTYVLTDEGYEVKALPHGHDVMPLVKEYNPDLILIDLMLAGIDGRTVVKMIKQNESTAKIPVVMMTARPELKPPPHEQYGPDDFMSKPFELENFRKKIAKYL